MPMLVGDSLRQALLQALNAEGRHHGRARPQLTVLAEDVRECHTPLAGVPETGPPLLAHLLNDAVAEQFPQGLRLDVVIAWLVEPQNKERACENAVHRNGVRRSGGCDVVRALPRDMIEALDSRRRCILLRCSASSASHARAEPDVERQPIGPPSAT